MVSKTCKPYNFARSGAKMLQICWFGKCQPATVWEVLHPHSLLVWRQGLHTGTKGKNMQLEDMLVRDSAGRLPGLGKGG